MCQEFSQNTARCPENRRAVSELFARYQDYFFCWLRLTHIFFFFFFWSSTHHMSIAVVWVFAPNNNSGARYLNHKIAGEKHGIARRESRYNCKEFTFFHLRNLPQCHYFWRHWLHWNSILPGQSKISCNSSSGAIKFNKVHFSTNLNEFLLFLFVWIYLFSHNPCPSSTS